MRKHSISCERAEPNSKCVCSCKGKLHGIKHRKVKIDKWLEKGSGSDVLGISFFESPHSHFPPEAKKGKKK